VKNGLSRFAESIVGLVLFVALWALASQILGKPNLLPTPLAAGAAAVKLLHSGALETDVWNSLSRVFQGFIAATIVAIPLGGAMGMIPIVQRTVHPVIEIIRPIPPIAVIPLSILWFGIGDVAQVFIVFYGAFFPMVVGVYGAYTNIDPIYGQAADTLGCHGIEKFWRVTFMAAFPAVLVSMRIGLGLAFVSLVAAELIGASSGLGYLVATSATTFQTPSMFVGILTIGIVGFALSAIFNLITRLVVHN
jgi:ABC-type nitrate/sulfonate/bicarbonate transport system permease component